jgi:hypothetical protein
MESGPKDTFSNEGYTQIFENGITDTKIEDDFCKVEENMPATLLAIKDAATRQLTELDVDLYNNMCWYFAFLYCLSPFFKAKSPIDFLADLHNQLEEGKGDLLEKYLTKHQSKFDLYKAEIKNGKKLIIDSLNFIQKIHQIQFNRLFDVFYYRRFRHCVGWTIFRSPIDIPLSDIAIIEVPVPCSKHTIYHIPISPDLLLAGVYDGVNTPKRTSIVSSALPLKMADFLNEMFFLSAQYSLISRKIIPDITERRKKASKTHAFNNVKNLMLVLNSGKKPFNGDLTFRVVSMSEFDNFIKQLVSNEIASDTIATSSKWDQPI